MSRLNADQIRRPVVMDGAVSKRPPGPVFDGLPWDNTLLPVVRLVEKTLRASQCHAGA
jgi:hypothetical protein